MAARRARGTREASQAREVSEGAQAFKPISHAYDPINILSEEKEQRVHDLSLRLLQEIGLKFLSEETWPILEQNGCKVDHETSMVYFPSEVLEQFLALAPSEFTMRARNPANNLHMGGEHIHYGSASSAPNSINMDRGRRPGTQADFEDLVKLNHMLGTCAFHTGHPVEPIDTPANTRHLSSAYSWHTLSDKVTRVYAIGGTRVKDSLDMIEIAYGIDRDELINTPCIHGSINVNSP